MRHTYDYRAILYNIQIYHITHISRHVILLYTTCIIYQARDLNRNMAQANQVILYLTTIYALLYKKTTQKQIFL